MNDDGTMARRDDLIKFGNDNDIKVGTIADLIDYRLSSDSTIESIHEKDVSNEFGNFKLIVWRDTINDEYHFSLTKGDLQSVESPLVRVQTHSILQDTLGIEDLGKNWSIRKSIERISKEEAGIFVLITKRVGAPKRLHHHHRPRDKPLQFLSQVLELSFFCLLVAVGPCCAYVAG